MLPLAHVTPLDLGIVALAFALGALAGFGLALRRFGPRPLSAPARRGCEPPGPGPA